ncbi:hypothetical protein IPC19_13890 [Pseudomonas aeruginosa]|nr:hypothetical protein [Pseudomonas aeruginosa]MCO1765806.1 hypothetical protein [Pseudomonas aeruginosa]RQI51124.1 hypothetical protein IPC19_13890 [Pseudomonas aeruginosa]HBP6040893.1 hypothetical protein [Pseudomonas aeruginosa]
MKPMIQAHLVERDQFGFWTHPNYPDLADNCSSSEAQETLRRLGLELQNVFMEADRTIQGLCVACRRSRASCSIQRCNQRGTRHARRRPFPS